MPFALVTPEMAAQAGINVLAVGGCFLLGQFLAGVGLWLLARKSPPGLKRVGRLLAGTLLAVLAAVVLFGHGAGWTLFGGGGTGLSKGNGPTPQAGDGPGPARPVPTPAPPVTTPPTATEPTTGPKVRVTVLGGGDVRDERFYRLDADPAARTFAELTAALEGKKAGGPLRAEVVFPSSNTLPRDHPAVTRLASWAAAHGVTVTFPAS